MNKNRSLKIKKFFKFKNIDLKFYLFNQSLVPLSFVEKDKHKHKDDLIDFYKVDILTKTVFGNYVYAFSKEVSKSYPWVIITGGIHAREFLSSDFVFSLMKRFKKLYQNLYVKNLCFCHYNKVFIKSNANDMQKDLIYYVLKNCETELKLMQFNEKMIKNKEKRFIFCKFAKINYNIVFVPQINPDGVFLVKKGITSLSVKDRTKLLKINNYSDDFSLFKANANGVDLNNNWDANWDKNFSGKRDPGSQGFYGFEAMSEKEVIGLGNLTKLLKPVLTISFHLKGEEIYYDFFQSPQKMLRDYSVAKIFSKSCGYKIKSTMNCSSGGYKDWCVEKLGITALTVELGSEKLFHPVGIAHLNEIVFNHKDFFYCLEKSVKSIKFYNKIFEL